MSQRDLTPAMITAVSAKIVYPIIMLSLDFPGGLADAWTGYGDLVWGGHTFRGVGDFGSISTVEEAADLSAKGLSFTISGIPSYLVAIALNENYSGRAAKMWLACLDPDGNLYADPYQLVSARMDVMEIEDTGDTSRITLTAENRMYDLNRNRERRWTDADQQALYPGDLGLQFINALQNKPLNWGIPAPVQIDDSAVTDDGGYDN